MGVKCTGISWHLLAHRGPCIGPREIALQLSTHTALVEDPSIILSTHDRQLTRAPDSCSRGFQRLWPFGASLLIHVHIIKKIKINLQTRPAGIRP